MQQNPAYPDAGYPDRQLSVCTSVSGLGTTCDLTAVHESTHFRRCTVFRTRIIEMATIFLYVDFRNVTRNYTFQNRG